MTNKINRVRSAAFLRNRHFDQHQTTPSHQTQSKHIFFDLAISESAVITNILDHQQGNNKLKLLPNMWIQSSHHRNKTTSLISDNAQQKMMPSSSLWRIMHSSRSETKLQNIEHEHIGKDVEEPIRINLMEKVQRIKSKRSEQEIKYSQRIGFIERVVHQKAVQLKKSGTKGNLEDQIRDLILPWHNSQINYDQRYQARLFKLKRVEDCHYVF